MSLSLSFLVFINHFTLLHLLLNNLSIDSEHILKTKKKPQSLTKQKGSLMDPYLINMDEEKFYQLLEIVCSNISDYKFYLHISNISKRCRAIAREKFLSFDFSHSKVNDDFLSMYYQDIHKFWISLFLTHSHCRKVLQRLVVSWIYWSELHQRFERLITDTDRPTTSLEAR